MAKSRTDASPMKDAYPINTAPRGAVRVSGKHEAKINTHNVANLPKGHGSNDDSPLKETFKKKH
jgi:hypothetical protein